MSGARPRVVIAGAGIGGLTAALGLADAGCAVHLVERARVLSEAGAGVQLSPNATRILDGYGILAKVRAAATAPQVVRIRRARDARVLALLPMGAEAERRWGAPNLVIHRADLQRILVEAVARRPAISLSTGIEVAGFVAGADKVAIGARRGLAGVSFEADLLVGADGLRSAVRRQLVDRPADAPVYSGRTAWRAMVPAERLPEWAREPATNLWLGRQAHLVHYPLLRGAAVNIVAIIQETARVQEAELEWNMAGDPAVLARRLAAWCREARGLVAAADDWRTWPLFERPPLPRWTAGRVALLGDAAHPMMPFLAQGAAQAIEDAAALAAAMSKAGDDGAALSAYASTRVARATRIQRESHRQGDIYHMGGSLAAARDLVMRTLGPARLLARYDWLYGVEPTKMRTDNTRIEA